ncbi:Protein phosphatase methylesterase 1 [Yarrowia sp. B02]|nr:Protein phosphatase methylesterase 1 [Yarrowia sp. B02]
MSQLHRGIHKKPGLFPPREVLEEVDAGSGSDTETEETVRSEEIEEEETDGLGDLGMPPPKRTTKAAPVQSSGIPSLSQLIGQEGKGPSRKYAPAEWPQYFKEKICVARDNDTFNVLYTPPDDPEAPVYVFHHGAGSCAESFALLSVRLREMMHEERFQLAASAKVREENKLPGIIAFDARGHGHTEVESTDYSLDAFTEDFAFVVANVVAQFGLTNNLILVGHSLGGAVVTNASHRNLIRQNVIGLAVLDVVEGTAIESLDSMQKILNSRPKTFPSVEKGIEWTVQSHTIRNRESACVSVPPTLKVNAGPGYTWRTDLMLTKPYWKGWFEGLSEKFISCAPAKLLILAGTDRLDKDLMVGQMQGKYQLIVFQESGHFVQEDAPDKAALSLIDFWKRNDKTNKTVPLFGAFRA